MNVHDQIEKMFSTMGMSQGWAWRRRWDAKSEEGSVADWLMSSKEEEGIQLLLHGDGDGMQNRKKVVSRMGTAMAMLCKGLSTRNGVGVSCCVLRRRTNQGRR